jgi:hypothetical protein
MKGHFEHRREDAVPLSSRPTFFRVAVATGGARIFSAELPLLRALGSAD